jgi:hypothetical protein
MMGSFLTIFLFFLGIPVLLADVGLPSTTRATIELKGSWQAAWSTEESIQSPIANAKWEGVAVPDKRFVSVGFPVTPDHKSLWYRLSFSAPSPAGRRAYLYFNRVGFQCRVWLNGKEIGNHIGYQTPFSIDVTDVLRSSGENLLLVGTNRATVAKRGEYSNLPKFWSAPAPGLPPERPDGKVLWPTGYGYWFVGLAQPVKLILTSPVYVEDIFIKTSVRQKEIDVQVEIQNPLAQAKTFQIATTLLDQGRVVKEFPPQEVRFSASDKSAVITLKEKWADPVLWTPDCPRLYHCRVWLMDGERLVDEAVERFGFREIWSKGTRLLLNGLPLLVRAETDHPGVWSWPREEIRRHIQKHKRIRGTNTLQIKAHTPADPEYWDVCDEEGMLVIHQIDSGGNNGPASDWDCAKAFAMELVRSTRNHPSIIIQQTGNENCYGYKLCVPFWSVPWTPNLVAVKEAATRIDPTRLRTVGGGDLDQGGKSDFIDFHGGPTTAWHELFPNLHTIIPRLAIGDGKKPLFFSEWNEWIDPTMCAVIGDDFFRPDPTQNAQRNPRSAYRQSRQAQGMSLKAGAAEFRKQRVAAFNIFVLDHIFNQDTWPVEGTRNLIQWTSTLRPVVAIPVSYSYRHWADRPIQREFLISNDSFIPLNGSFAWRLLDEHHKLLIESEMPIQLQIGEQKTIGIEIPSPVISGSTGRFVLQYQIIQGDDLLYEDSHPVTVFRRPEFVKLPSFAILGTDGHTHSLLAKAGVRLRSVSKPSQAGQDPLIVPTLAKMDEGSWRELEAMIRQGGRVLILHRADWPKTLCRVNLQKAQEANAYGVPYFPPKGTPHYATIQCGFGSTYGFIRAARHPVLSDLADEDLRCWAGKRNYTMPFIVDTIRWPAENVLALDNLRKPDGNGLFRCLIDAGYHNGMDISLLMEIPSGSGRAFVSTLLLAEKTADDPAAERVLFNCLRYLADEKPNPLRSILPLSNVPELEAIGFSMDKKTNSLDGSVGAVVLDARRVKWDELKPRTGDIRSYLNRGGTLYIHRLTPATAQALNSLLGLKVSCAPVPAPTRWWLDSSKMAFPKKERVLTAGIGNFDMNWTVIQCLIYEGLQLPDPVIEYTISSSDSGAEPLTEAIDPASALLRIPVGQGQIVIDQVLWDLNPETREYVAKIDAGHGPDPGRLKDVKTSNDQNRRKARRYISTLMTNILDPIK